MPHVAFGTAHLYGLVDDAHSGRLLGEAWRAGFRRFDTAPSYGAGRSEPHLATFLAGRDGVETVTTKVGLAPAAGPRRGRGALVAVAKSLLPPGVTRRLRRSAHAAAGGHFSPAEVQASVEESLRRLGGHVDRLVLHEVQPDEITPDLVDLLDRLRRQGDVGEVGVATQNHLTQAALAAGGATLTVVHVAVGPLHPPVPLPEHVTTRVGHGLLGGGGEHLHRMRSAMTDDPEVAERWRGATAGTPFEGSAGLADALLSRGPHLDVTDLLVATTRVDQVARTYGCASREEPLPAPVADALDALAERVPATRA